MTVVFKAINGDRIIAKILGYEPLEDGMCVGLEHEYKHWFSQFEWYDIFEIEFHDNNNGVSEGCGCVTDVKEANDGIIVFIKLEIPQ